MFSYFLAVIVSVFIVLYLICIFGLLKSKRPYRKDMINLLAAGITPLVANGCIVMSRFMIVSRFGYALYFISSNVMLYFLLRFVLIYCKLPYKKVWYSRLFLLIAVADSISIILNPMYKHVFVIKEYEAGGMIRYGLSTGPYYDIHITICYVAALVGALILIATARKGSDVYYPRYVSIVIAIMFTVVWNIVVLILHSRWDTSWIGIGVTGLVVYYFLIIYKPKALISRMLAAAASASHNGLIVYDDEDKCIFVNKRITELFDISETDYEKIPRIVKRVVGPSLPEENIAQVTRCEKYEDGDDRIFSTVLSRVYDSHNKYAGYFLSINDITDEELALAKEMYDATHDSLTDTYNADTLYRMTREKLEEDPDTDYIVLASNIKDFKVINDIFGRDEADKILKSIAYAVRKSLRKADLFGRLGADRFGLLMKKENFKADMFEVGARNLSYVKNDSKYQIVIHVGVYEITDKKMDARAMYDRALFAVDNIRDNLKQLIAYYDDSLRDEVLWENKIVGDLDRAIRNGELVPYIQAQVDRDEKINGGEVLVRWNHSTEGFLPPYKFIGILEKNGLIVKADHCMWEAACKLLKKWNDMGYKDKYLSVNISPRDFYFTDVYKDITGYAEQYEIDPKQLHLEVTETVMLKDAESKMALLNKLRDKGFVIGMDDFGSGYSSLNMLKDMPVDVLKIDMLFLRNNQNEEIIRKTQTILGHIISMAKDIGLHVVSEGVETEKQRDFLIERGTDKIQGYFYSKPIPADEFEEKYIFGNG